MGIRFYCPNGHKLNVKDFQAGKRGICPECESRFRIPQESQIPKDAPKVRPDDSLPNPSAQTVSVAATATAVEQLPIGSLAAGAAHAAIDAPTPNPIAEAPDAVWYVRPPSGGQFGPAKGDVMQRWITEGRVSAETLVWREGWPDWKTAGPLFSTLAPTANEAESSFDAPTEIKVETEDAPIPTRAKSRTQRNLARTSNKSITMVVTLTLVIVALLVVLVLVLNGTR